MKKISVALATFNEEKNLEDCLKSVFGWVDETVIVDGGSIDRTLEIARKYKAKIIETDNPPIFHINKQKAIEACSGEWILQLDADERVSKELQEEILLVTNDQRPTTNDQIGYWMPRKNYFLGRFLAKGGQYPDYTLRLYRRGKAHFPCESVHEQAAVEGKTERLKNPLIHMADPTLARYFTRFGCYTDLMAQDLKKGEFRVTPFSSIDYLIIKPFSWFFLTFFRHKGFMDSWQGFLFSFFSSLRFPVSFFKYLKKR